MHFNQISKCKWHLRGTAPSIDENLIWSLALWLYLSEISDEHYLPVRNRNLNLKKLARFDLGVLLNNNTAHKRAIIPSLLFIIENQVALDSHTWGRILNNFRKSPRISMTIYYDIVKKTSHDVLDCIVLFSIDNDEDYNTEKYFADRGTGFIITQKASRCFNLREESQMS